MTKSIDAKLARLMCYYDNVDRQGLIAALRTELSALAAAQAEPAHPLQNANDAERLGILKAIGDAGLILIKTHLGFELVKKSLVLACKQEQA